MDISKRLSKDAEIDFRSITIDVKGRVNGVKSFQENRSEHANPNDGFVYTSSTKKDASGKKFYYRYEGLDMGTQLNKTLAHDPNADDAMLTNMDYYRDDKNNEGIINVFADVQINGQATKTENFIFNEGNEMLHTDVGDVAPKHSIDKKNSLPIMHTKSEGYAKSTTVNFYDQYADIWTPELTEVRNLTGQ
jgi:hypothetical protein